MIVHLFASEFFWFNAFPSPTTGTGLSDTKVPGKRFLGTVVNYKKVFRQQPGEYVQVHQEDKPRNTIDID